MTATNANGDTDEAASARDWTAADAADWLLRPTANSDKYSRGVVGMRTGSARFPGAAVLGVEAAWRAGTGMVRYLGPERAADHVLLRRPETVTADGRVQAWVLGSGTDAADRGDDETTALRGILSGAEPVVADAGALELAAEGSAPRVLTPHGRELSRLREALGMAPANGIAAARETAERTGATVLLKGARTIVATPGGWCASVRSHTHWLATAGTGDVLAGAMGAVVASRASAVADDPESLGPLAATAAWVHQQAATRASQDHGGGPITALDVAERLSYVVGELIG